MFAFVVRALFYQIACCVVRICWFPKSGVPYLGVLFIRESYYFGYPKP